MVPVSLAALRREEPDLERPFRLPVAGILAPLSFIVANELILFSGWAVDWKLLVAIAIGLVLLGASFATTPPEERPTLDWRHAAWILPYLIGIGVISYLGSFSTSSKSSVLGLDGPTNTLPFGWDVFVMAVFSCRGLRARDPDAAAPDRGRGARRRCHAGGRGGGHPPRRRPRRVTAAATGARLPGRAADTLGPL